MLATEEDVVALLRIVGFLFLFVGVYPSMIFTPIFIFSSIVNHTPFFYLPFLGILSFLYVVSALGYFFVVKARNLDRQASS